MIIFGKNVVKEAIFAKRPIFNLYLDKKFNDDKFLQFLTDKKIKFEQKTKEELNKLTDNQLHQGVVANVKDYEYHELKNIMDTSKKQRFIILDGIEDPHNLGAILRTAEAVQLDGIIMSKKNQVPLNGTVAKVSSGAIEHVKVILVNNINQAIKDLQDNHIFVVGTDGSAQALYTEIDNQQSLAVILGHEGQGMRHLVKQNCDMLVKIPMYGKVNSLNVSVAAALLMYATLKWLWDHLLGTNRIWWGVNWTFN